MKQQTKENVKNGFKSLISNNAVTDSAKNTPWWLALILGLVAAFLPVIPITVNNANSYGASFLAKYTQNIETSLTSTCLSLKDDAKLKVEGGQLSYYKKVGENFEKQTDVSSESDILLYSYEATRDGVTQIDFQLFYTTASTSSKAEVNVNSLVKNYIEASDYSYAVGTTTRKKDLTEEEQADKTYYTPSYIVLGKTCLYSVLKKYDSTTNYNYTAYTGNWNHTAEGTDLIADSLKVYDDEGVAITANMENPAYLKGVLNNWKGYFNESYLTQKDYNVKFSLLVYYGIYLLMILFMAFMMFLLTRGKKNMFNYLKFGMCLKMAAWASVSPAILSLILGFIISSYAMMFFIILIGIRIMWMSMKQLRPQY